MSKVLIIRPGAKPEVDEFPDTFDSRARLRWLQDQVGGYIEGIGHGNPWIGFVNEDGIALELPNNPLAAYVATMNGWPAPFLFGPVIFLGPEGEDEEHDDDVTYGDVPQEMVDQAEQLWSLRYRE